MKKLKEEEIEVYKPSYDSYALDLPPSTAEGVENECIHLAYDLVRRRLIEGTATPTETTLFLKLGTQQARLDLEKTRKEVELMDAKMEALQSAKRLESLYNDAIEAMRDYSYRGQEEFDSDYPVVTS